MVLDQLELIYNMDRDIKKIKERIIWLETELIHHGYLEGVVIENYKKEIDKLNKELEKIENKDTR